MEGRLKLSKKSTVEAVNATGYRRVIGALRQLDLAFLIGYLSHFMEVPREDHLIAVKRILRYVAGIRSHMLHYTKCEEGSPKLIGYSNADMGATLTT
jgi:hypothetical protein